MYKEMIPASVFHSKRAANGPDPEQLEASACSDRCTAEIQMLQQSRGDLNDRYVRLQAEFDNFKKRTASDNQRHALAQKDAFIRDLLPVVDNLERALRSASPEPAANPITNGVQLILRQLVQVLEWHGLLMRDDLGQEFDPRFHDAIGTRLDPGRADNTVVEVWERGWQRGSQLFRPAKVIVNTRPGSAVPNCATPNTSDSAAAKAA
jgi:molecular chaperone GrpE